MHAATNVIEEVTYKAVRPSPRSAADAYLKMFYPGARGHRDPVSIDDAPIAGATYRFEFVTISGATETLYLGEAASGGWLVKGRQRALQAVK
jgi:hypothetical protein